MRIIGPPSASMMTVLDNLPVAAAPLFRQEMFQPLWNAGITYEIDPVGVIAQSLKETGLGRFPGKVKPEFYNTCGLKNRHLGLYPGTDDGDNPLAHARFASWDVGAAAHVQHLCAYTAKEARNLTADPRFLIVDPRYWLVIGKHRCENWRDLGGKWAPSPDYGDDIEVQMKHLQNSRL